MSSISHIDQCIEAFKPYIGVGLLALAGIVFANILISNFVHYYLELKSRRNQKESQSDSEEEAEDSESSTSEEESYDVIIDVANDEYSDSNDDEDEEESKSDDDEDITLVTPDNTVVTLHADGNSTVVTPCGTTIAIDEQDGNSAVATVITPDSKVYANIEISSDIVNDFANVDAINAIVESVY